MNWSYQKLHAQQLGRHCKGHVAVTPGGRAGECSGKGAAPLARMSEGEAPRAAQAGSGGKSKE